MVQPFHFFGAVQTTHTTFHISNYQLYHSTTDVEFWIYIALGLIVSCFFTGYYGSTHQTWSVLNHPISLERPHGNEDLPSRGLSYLGPSQPQITRDFLRQTED